MSQGHPTVESDGEEQPGSESESDNMESESSLKESQYGSLEVCPTYDEIQEAGAQRRRWIADPGLPGCYISHSMLTFHDFAARYVSDNALALSSLPRDPVSLEVMLDPNEVLLEPDTIFGIDFDRSGPYQCFYLDAYKGITWTGYTGPGVIWLKNIWKNDNATISLPFSQITQAFYERDFAINTLNHVFMTVVVNEETLGVVEKLYLDNFGRLGIQLVEESECSMMAWTCGTPQFDALLGTRLGKLAAYLVLGAFPRGSRRIVQVVVQYDWTTEFPTLRFDIG